LRTAGSDIDGVVADIALIAIHYKVVILPYHQWDRIGKNTGFALLYICITVGNQLEGTAVKASVNTDFQPLSAIAVGRLHCNSQVGTTCDKGNPLHVVNLRGTETRRGLSLLCIIVDTSISVDITYHTCVNTRWRHIGYGPARERLSNGRKWNPE
jgi:hypothetical protein